MYRHALRILTAAALTTAVFAVVPAVDGHARAAARTTSLTLVVHGCERLRGPAGESHRGRPGPRVAREDQEGPERLGALEGSDQAHGRDELRHQRTHGGQCRGHTRHRGGLPRHRRRRSGAGRCRQAQEARHRLLGGTHKASITLRVRVEQFPATSAFPPPVEGFSIRPYFVRTRAHLPPYTRTFHGQIGNQDAYFCVL